MQRPGAPSTTVEKDAPPAGPDAIVSALFSLSEPRLSAPTAEGGVWGDPHRTSQVPACRLPQKLNVQRGGKSLRHGQPSGLLASARTKNHGPVSTQRPWPSSPQFFPDF